MILTAVAILTNLDVNFDQFVAGTSPTSTSPRRLSARSTVTGRLHEITGASEVRAANGPRLRRLGHEHRP
jgi:hypothetical protein